MLKKLVANHTPSHNDRKWTDNKRKKRMIQVSKPLFQLGQVVATPGAIEAMQKAGQVAWEFLSRHVAGDWGIVDADDKAANDASLKDGSRILSAYTLNTGEKIWVITEATDDQGKRAATTILLPDEY
jgi:hypothetical protein